MNNKKKERKKKKKKKKKVIWWMWVVWATSALFEVAAVIAIVWGVTYEVVHKAPKGSIVIAIAAGLAIIGSALFAKVYAVFWKEYN